MAIKGQKFKKYPSELKRQIVMERIEKHTPYLELAFRYGIASQESVMQWVKNYREFGEASFKDKRGTATAETSKLKGRPRKYFDSEEEKREYQLLVKQRNKERNARRRRIERYRKKKALLQEAKK
ncbi:MAG: helix-turn-helix domain-containing protein [Bacilli bacterium]|nr:helix-turn-helix domain-containing protein [Bacilli bacterium]